MGKERNNFLKSLPQSLNFHPVGSIKIGNREIGLGKSVFIIAEVGANHRGKIENAYKLIDKAKQAGADAIKFQHLTHDKIAADVNVYDSWNGKPVGSLSSFYKFAEMPYEWTAKLISYCKKTGIVFLSTPFDKEAVDILDKAKVPAFKVASYELTDDVLLEYIAKKNRPMIVSTGMADIEEVAHAIKVITQAGNNQIVLLHCSSIYPPKFSDLNLKAIDTLRETFKFPVGYSDHSRPPFISAIICSVALGACVIEKHITDDKSGGSNDDPNSMEIEEFKKIVKEIRNSEKALSGDGTKQPISHKDHLDDEVNDRWARRSVYALKDIKSGEKLTTDSVITLRPWGGIKPKDLKLFLGKRLIKSIKAREPLTIEHFCN